MLQLDILANWGTTCNPARFSQNVDCQMMADHFEIDKTYYFFTIVHLEKLIACRNDPIYSNFAHWKLCKQQVLGKLEKKGKQSEFATKDHKSKPKIINFQVLPAIAQWLSKP